MTYIRSQADSDLAAMMHGTDLGDIVNQDGLWYRAARSVLARIDPAETRRITPISNVIHDNVYNYTAPSDLKGNKIIDIRPQVSRTVADNPTQLRSQRFDLRKALRDRTVQVKHDDATKSIRISWNVSPSPTTLHAMNSLSGNGTWAAVGSATDIAVDSQFYVSGSGSIKFTHNITGDGIQITGMASVDLSNHDEVSELFVWAYFLDGSNVTSATFVWGNDLTTNFWTSAETTTQADGTSFQIGWNLFKFMWNAATESGTVDPETIDSLKFTVAGSSVTSPIRVDNIISSIGKPFDIEYYSKFLFRSSSGTFQETTTASDDIINLDTDSYNILVYETAILAAQQVQGQDMTADINFFREQLHDSRIGLYAKYVKQWPSEAMNPVAQYYSVRSPNR